MVKLRKLLNDKILHCSLFLLFTLWIGVILRHLSIKVDVYSTNLPTNDALNGLMISFLFFLFILNSVSVLSIYLFIKERRSLYANTKEFLDQLINKFYQLEILPKYWYHCIIFYETIFFSTVVSLLGTIIEIANYSTNIAFYYLFVINFISCFILSYMTIMITFWIVKWIEKWIESK